MREEDVLILDDELNQRIALLWRTVPEYLRSGDSIYDLSHYIANMVAAPAAMVQSRVLTLRNLEILLPDGDLDDEAVLYLQCKVAAKKVGLEGQLGVHK